MRGVLLGVLVALLTIGSASAQVTAPDETAVEVAFVSVDPTHRVLRFVAYLRHPHEYAVEGITTRWEAYDAGGASVGSRTVTHPPIPAGMAFPYVGVVGSTLLSGTPEHVVVSIVDPGRRTSVRLRVFPADDVQIEPTDLDADGIGEDYVVSATLATDDHPVERSDVTLVIILRDADGAIVGADSTSPREVPAVLPPNTHVPVEGRATPANAEPATAELLAYVSPR